MYAHGKRVSETHVQEDAPMGSLEHAFVSLQYNTHCFERLP